MTRWLQTIKQTRKQYQRYFCFRSSLPLEVVLSGSPVTAEVWSALVSTDPHLIVRISRVPEAEVIYRKHDSFRNVSAGFKDVFVIG